MYSAMLPAYTDVLQSKQNCHSKILKIIDYFASAQAIH